MITINSDGTYRTDVWPTDPSWKLPKMQEWLKEAEPIDRAFSIGAINLDEYNAYYKLVNDYQKLLDCKHLNKTEITDESSAVLYCLDCGKTL